VNSVLLVPTFRSKQYAKSCSNPSSSPSFAMVCECTCSEENRRRRNEVGGNSSAGRPEGDSWFVTNGNI
jgi:hypothetical protein